MRFREAEVEEEERKEVANDATLGGNNHKTFLVELSIV